MSSIKAHMVAALILICCSCGNHPEKLVTSSVKVGDHVCIVQKMPASFQEENGTRDGRFDYYRLIMESNAPVEDSSAINYINFGMQDAVKLVCEGDSISPATMERVANGKKNSYEYMMAFEKAGTSRSKRIEIAIDDKVLGFGKVTVPF